MKHITRLTVVYILSLFFLTPLFYEQESRITPNYSYEPPPFFVRDAKKRVLANFKHKELVPFAVGMIFGGRQGVKRELKRPYNLLGMGHIFTPAGLHFSALLYILFPLTFFLGGRRKRSVRRFCTLGLSLLVFLLPGFHSLKRLALFRWVIFITERLEYKIDYFILLLITFLIDFVVGTCLSSPLSYGYSLLFLGIFLSPYPKRFLLLLALGGGQFIVSFFGGEIFLTTSFLFNFFLSSLFSIIYPVIFFSFWIHLYPLMEICILCFHKLVLLSAFISLKLGFLFPSIPLIILILFFTLKNIELKTKIMILLFCLVIHSEPLNLFPKASNVLPMINPGKKVLWSLPPAKELLESKLNATQDGYRLKFKGKIRCNVKLIDLGWRISCSGPNHISDERRSVK